jgi:diaminohydroxyphosphoribosylaminopyrimidine deaminase/5-amino-6-(5-phosphoribosylamino)uracil reductase
MSFPNLDSPGLNFEKMEPREKFMHRCLELALRGAGSVAPNPLVGAVLVHESRIIGEGWHQQYGQAHAEVNCVNDAIANGFEPLLRYSTLFVNLEPCSHTGKTPPCTDLITRYKIPRVVVGIQDPYKQVSGRGIQKLEEAGIEVTVNVLKAECTDINRRFFTFHRERRPYIILKWAQTVQGIIGSGKKRLQISNDYSNRLVHAWRSEEAAIMVGANTARIDNPSLTNRRWPGNSPIRLIIDPELSLDRSLRLFDGVRPLVVFNHHRHEVSSTDPSNIGGVNYYRLEKLSIPSICSALHELKILSVLVEGGAKLLQSFIDSVLWDEARVITSANNKDHVDEPVMAPLLSRADKFKEISLASDQLEFFEPAP